MKPFDGREIKVMIADNRRGPVTRAPPPTHHDGANTGGHGGGSTCKMFVGGLAWKTTSDSLRRTFEDLNVGAVTEARVIMEKEDPNKSRGFGFVLSCLLLFAFGKGP